MNATWTFVIFKLIEIGLSLLGKKIGKENVTVVSEEVASLKQKIKDREIV